MTDDVSPVDVLSNRKVLAAILRKKGVEADLCENGLECLEAVKNKGLSYYDIIFMDNQMPLMVRVVGVGCVSVCWLTDRWTCCL